jgi:hypothetical protein
MGPRDPEGDRRFGNGQHLPLIAVHAVHLFAERASREASWTTGGSERRHATTACAHGEPTQRVRLASERKPQRKPQRRSERALNALKKQHRRAPTRDQTWDDPSRDGPRDGNRDGERQSPVILREAPHTRPHTGPNT